MRISDILSFSEADNDVTSQVIDFMTIMNAEDVSTISLDTLLAGLQNQGITVDKATLFDILDNLAIVKNIKDDVVYFNSNSDDSMYGQQHDPEKDDKVVDKLARQKMSKELGK